MSRKLYVGNLSFNTTQDQIHKLFSQAGVITDIAVILDRETGRSRGFCFVEMATEDGFREAIRRFNGYRLDNRILTVNEARPRESRPMVNSGYTPYMQSRGQAATFGTSRGNSYDYNRRSGGLNRNRF